MCVYCTFIPEDVLRSLAELKSLSAEVKRDLISTAELDNQVRQQREQARKLAKTALSISPMGFSAVAAAPNVTVYNCNHTTSLPGVPVNNPGSSPDATAKRTFQVTTEVAAFYKTVFGRNSIDNAGMTLMSSIHYGTKYNNAFWNGQQMTYGDGDGSTFIDFTLGDDVVCHELTHGVTQSTLQLVYTNEPGGLNESMSDVFGSIFRQWRAKQNVTAADWLIGADIMGPDAKKLGYKCLRNMADPAAKSALSPQPKHYKKYKAGMDPHESSGIPNYAFYLAAKARGGNSWDKVGQVWYKVLTGAGSSPNMKMKKFADLTRKAATGDAPTLKAVDDAWKAVGL